MAIIENGIHGAFSGKVGTVVGYIRKGRGIMRVQNKRTTPPTKKELLNREKFAVSQKWLSPLTDFFRISFKDYQPTFEGFIAAKSYNHKNALQLDENNKFFINPELALVSFGSQELPSSASAIANNNQEIVFTWNTKDIHEYNDQAMVVVYDIEGGRMIYNAGIARRGAGTATLTLTDQPIGKTFHAYLAFIADDRSSKSNSMYLGSFLIS